MSLSSDLISQFVKVTNDKKDTKRETTAYGTIVKNDSSIYVKLDGSDLSTPVVSTAFVNNGDRVTVMIKNHTAIVTGNISSPSANGTAVIKAVNRMSEFETLMAYKVNAEELAAAKATIESLKAKITDANVLKAVTADIENLQTKFADLEYVGADDVAALNADIENLRTTFGKFMSISAEDLKAINADIDQLRSYTANFTYVSADMLKILKAGIDGADNKYAYIDFSNVGEIAMKKFYTDSGLIKDVKINNGTITGKLSGVTIGGIDVFDNKLAAITTDSDNIATGFELKSDGSFISKGGTNHDYVYNLEVKSGALRLSSFQSPSGLNGQGAVLNANGLYFKKGDSNGEELSSICSDLSDNNLHLKSVNGFDFYFKENGMRIVFDGTNGKIWRVDADGTRTVLAG